MRGHGMFVVVSVVLVGSMGITSCGGGRMAQDPFGPTRRTSPPPPRSIGEAVPDTVVSTDSVRIDVRNVNFNDAAIFALVPTLRRLGRVEGTKRATFYLPASSFTGNVLGGDVRGGVVRLRAELLGGKECTTYFIEAQGGDIIDMIIESAVRPQRPNGARSLCGAERREPKQP